MSRPQSEAEYLARMVPPSAAATQFGRRALLKAALGVGAAAGLSGALAACGGSSSTSGSGGGSSSAGASSSGGGGKPVKLGSNYSDATPKAAMKAVTDAFTQQSGSPVSINTVDHNTFQENINNYLQGKPDDVFTWFAGFRMRFFAAQGLAGDISDVWSEPQRVQRRLQDRLDGRRRQAVLRAAVQLPVGALLPAVACGRSKGYTVPKTLDELTTLSKQMQKDGLVPIAFADKDGWPAMGTFDILNMRINGYQFHVDLMAGKEAWDAPKVKKVFDTWTSILPYHQDASLGPDLAGGRPGAAAEEGRHVPARLLRRPAGRQRPGPRLLHLPGDRLRPSAPTRSTPRSTAS